MNLENKTNITEVIESLLSKVSNCLFESDGLTSFVDPNDNEEIKAHYGTSHVMASMILYGSYTGNNTLKHQGTELLTSLLEKIEDNCKLPAYHFDFNNFAIALALDKIEDPKLKSRAEKALLSQPDSNHNTINWLPMRIFANSVRYSISKESRFQHNMDECRALIEKGINQDGSIEDRLPKGLSFNLQYDISTLALLYFLNNRGFNFELSKSTGFVLQCVAPDSDINYQGRGTNQVFAWGPWLYILSMLDKDQLIESALKFLLPRLKNMLFNDNMMLNNWVGSEKHLWWDYHYASVYTSHILLWLVLSVIDDSTLLRNTKIETVVPEDMVVRRNDKSMVAIFKGRTEYLAEKGPSVCAIYFNGESIVKGAFGPWRGLFGNNNSIEDIVIRNYCGLFKTNKSVKRSLASRVLHKLGIHEKLYYELKPLFVPVSAKFEGNDIIIEWSSDQEIDAFFSIPSLSTNVQFQLTIDGNSVPLFCTQKIKTQYDWALVYQSKVAKGFNWTLRVAYKKV